MNRSNCAHRLPGRHRRRPGTRGGPARAATAVAVAVLAAAVLAVVDGSPAWAQPPAAPNSLEQVVDGLRFWIMGIIAAVATLFLVVGGLRYITAGGDPSQIEQAKGNLKSALLGYALAVLAPILLTVLQGILGV
jgi:succinate dehydrogenase hydrophobic anchor subunit